MTDLEKMAREHDREEAAMMGEPDPWKDNDDEPWKADRLACMALALKAIREPSTPVISPALFTAMIDHIISEAEKRT